MNKIIKTLSILFILGMVLNVKGVQAKELQTKIIKLEGNVIHVQDMNGKKYCFNKAEEDKDNYNIGEEITIDVMSEYKGTITSIEKDLISVNINGDIFKFYGDNYYIGQSVNIFMNDEGEIVDVF